jgi:hypothetical protein
LTAKKAPCVDMKTDVHKDPRFEVLGELAGYNKYEAIGRLHALWSWCTDRGLKDAPDDCDGYAVSEPIIRRFLGPRGVVAILADDCDEFALAERRDDGLLYLRGTSEYVAARREHSRGSSAGGIARSRGPRGRDGRFGEPTNNHPAEPWSRQPSQPGLDHGSPAPSSSPSSSSSDPRSETPRESTSVRADAPPQSALSVLPDGFIPADTEQFRVASRLARDKGLDVAIELIAFIAHARDKNRTSANWTSAFVKWLTDARPANTRAAPKPAPAAKPPPKLVVVKPPPPPEVRPLSAEEMAEMRRMTLAVAANATAAVQALDVRALASNGERREGRTRGVQDTDPRVTAKEATG